MDRSICSQSERRKSLSLVGGSEETKEGEDGKRGNLIQPMPCVLVWREYEIRQINMIPDLSRMFGGELPKMSLLWSGRRDGYNAYEFHRRCDNKGATLTVIQSKRNDQAVPFVFGGFNPFPWSKDRNHSPGAGSWLFSLQSYTGLVTKLLNSDSTYGAFNHRQYGPYFGRGPDLCINSTMQMVDNFSHPRSYTTVAPGFSG